MGVDGQILMLADGSAQLTKALGVELDLTEKVSPSLLNDCFTNSRIFVLSVKVLGPYISHFTS